MPDHLFQNPSEPFVIPALSDGGMDDNEAFIQRNLCRYLGALSRVFSVLDANFIDLAVVALGPDVGRIIRQLKPYVPCAPYDRLIQDLKNAEDADDVAREISHAASNFPSRSRKRLFQFFRLGLQRKASAGGDAVAVCLLEKNVRALADMLRLCEDEREFLRFLVVLTFSDPAETYFVSHLRCHVFSRRHLLATALGLSRPRLDEIMAGRLAQLGLFEADWHGLAITTDYLRLFENPDVEALPDLLYRRVKGAALPLNAYLVDPNDRDFVLDLISLHGEGSPTHILLYGPPGTGKTSYARTLAETAGKTAYEILHTDDNNSRKRRMAIVACLNMLGNSGEALLIVDEADNLLNTTHSWFHRGETQDKGWLNRLMEEPGPGFIWIVNHTGEIEPSVLRRFAHSIRFPEFGPRERARVLESVLRNNRAKRMVSDEQLRKLAHAHNVSAGPMDMAVKKALETGTPRGAAFFKRVSLSLSAHEKLLAGGIAPPAAYPEEKAFDLEGLNIDGEMDRLLEGLDAWAERFSGPGGDEPFGARLLFHGPPGSGKSETARYLAKRLGMDLHVKTASDIIDPYVGMTERNIREAFDAAAHGRAVLVIDEADTFLFPRKMAHRSWEVSHTNEFLTQMERFSGLLICTTNRFPDMDEASVRRFTHKLGFGFLTADGNETFYNRLLAPLAAGRLPKARIRTLRGMTGLTPGDFAAVRDRFRFPAKRRPSHDDLMAALDREARIKKERSWPKAIGF